MEKLAASKALASASKEMEAGDPDIQPTAREMLSRLQAIENMVANLHFHFIPLFGDCVWNQCEPDQLAAVALDPDALEFVPNGANPSEIGIDTAFQTEIAQVSDDLRHVAARLIQKFWRSCARDKCSSPTASDEPDVCIVCLDSFGAQTDEDLQCDPISADASCTRCCQRFTDHVGDYSVCPDCFNAHGNTPQHLFIKCDYRRTPLYF